MAKYTIQGIAAAMVEAGIFTQEEINNTRRIVIDLDVRSVPIMYIERFTDDKFVKVVTTLQGIDIRREEKPDGYNPRDGQEGGGLVEGQDPEGAGSGRDQEQSGSPEGWDPREEFSPGSY